MKIRQSALAAVLGVVVLFSLGGDSRPVAAAKVSEYELKAAILYNFAKMVEWPAAKLGEGSKELVIGLVAHEHCSEELMALAGKALGQRTIQIKHVDNPAEAEACHVLFIHVMEKDQAKNYLEKLAGKSVLTVGEAPGFAASGGILNFTVQDRKIKFEVNAEAAERAGLKLKPELIKLGIPVRQP